MATTDSEGRSTALLAKAGRYLLATAFGAPINVALYLFLARRVGMTEPLANVLAALTIIGPRFLINKYWVWRHRSTARIGFEARMHVLLTAAGLGLSTAVAWRLGEAEASTTLLAVGNVGAFAIIWVVRFLLFNYAVFTPRPTVLVTDEPTGAAAQLGARPAPPATGHSA